jgi:hypothetical protein
MRLSRWLGPALLLAGTILLLRWPGASDLWQRVDRLGPGSWLLAVLGLLGSHGLRALRLHAEWQPRRGARRLECLRVALLHSAAVNLLPLRSGELGFPWLLWRRWGVPVVESASSLLWMRAQDALVLVWLGALSAAALLAGGGPLSSPWPPLLAAAATLAFLGLISRTAAWSVAAPAPWTRPGAPRWRALVAAFRAALAGASPLTWAWCVANWVLKLGTLGALMAVLLDGPMLAGWCAALGGEGAAALPVQAPAGFGTYEAAAALGARLGGAAATEQALVAALAVHLFTIAVTLAGALWASLSGGPHARPLRRAAGRS